MIGDNSGRVLRKWRYPTKKELYEEMGDGTVKVTRDDGRWGLFRCDGKYLEGDLTQANVHMIVWTGGPPLPPECNWRWTEVPVDINRPSGWPEAQERVLHYQMGKAT